MIRSIEEYNQVVAEVQEEKNKKKEKQINTLNNIAANSPQSRLSEDKKNILSAVTQNTQLSRKNAMLNNMKDVYQSTDRTSRYQTGDMHENVTEPFKPMSDNEYKMFLLNAERNRLQKEYVKNPYTIEYDEKSGRNVQRPTQAAYRIWEIDRELKAEQARQNEEMVKAMQNRYDYESKLKQNNDWIKNIGSAFAAGGRGILKGISGTRDSIQELGTNAVYDEPYNFRKHIKNDVNVIQNITDRKPELIPDIEKYFVLTNKYGSMGEKGGSLFANGKAEEMAERKKIEEKLRSELGNETFSYINDMAQYRNPIFYLKDENTVSAQKGGLANINFEQSGLAQKDREYTENKMYAPKAQQKVMNATESIPLTAASAAASVVHPALGLGLMGATSYGNSYAEAQQNEYNPAKSAGVGAAKALIEVGTEAMPIAEFSGAITSLAKTGIKGAAKNIAKTMGSQLIEENIGEQLSLLGEKIVDQTAYGDGGWDTYLDEFIETAEATTLSTLFFTGATLSTSSALGAIDNRRQKKIAENVKAVEQKTESGELDGSNIKDNPNYKEVVKDTVKAITELNESGKLGEVGVETPSVNGAENGAVQNTNNMAKIVEEYKNSTDSDLIDFISMARKNPNGSRMKYELSDVSERLANDIKAKTNIDVVGFSNTMKSNTITHIDKRHGVNGAADQSMSDINDIARMQYVIDNYDNIELLDEKSREYKESKGEYAPLIRLSKRVNGNYYVVEAVPDTKRRELAVISAYKNKAVEQQVADVSSPILNVRNAPPDTAFDNNISQNEGNVKNSEQNNSAVEFSPMQNNAPMRIGRPINNTANGSEHFKNFESTFRANIERKRGVSIDEPVFSELDQRTLTKEQRQVIFDAKNLGIDVTFFRQTNNVLKDLNEEINGAYKDGKIYLNEDTDAPYKSILGHELLHHLKKVDTAAYNKILSMVREMVNERTDFDSIADSIAENNEDRTAVSEEIIADVMGDILQNPLRYRQVLRQNMSITQKIVSFVRDMIDRFYKKPRIGYTADKSGLMNILKSSEKELATIMAEGLANGQRSASDNGVVKFSVKRDIYGNTIETLELSEEAVLKEFGIERINDYVHVQKQVIKTLREKGFFSDVGGNSRTVTNKDSGMIIKINPKGIKETFSSDHKYLRLGKKLKLAKLATVKYLPYVIENGVLVSDNIPNYHDTSSNNRFAYIRKEIKFDDKDLTIEIAVRKSVEKNKFWMHKVEIKEKSLGRATSASVDNTETAFRTSETDKSIADSNEIVKGNFENGIKYSKKGSAQKLYEVVDTVDNSDKFMKIKREKNPKDGAMAKYKFDWERPSRKSLENDEEYNKIIEKIKGKNDVYKIPTAYYTNDVYRIFRDFFGEDYSKIKELVLDKLDDSKRAYIYIRDFYTNILYDKIVNELGIKKGSKMSEYVQLYGEKKMTEKELLAEEGITPNDVEKIKKADKIFRWMYDSLIETINDSRRIIYPNVEKNISSMKAGIKDLNDKLGELKEALAKEDFTTVRNYKKSWQSVKKDESLAKLIKTDIEKLEKKIANKEKKLEEYKKSSRGQRIYKRDDYYRHFREMETGDFAALRNILGSSASISNELAAISEFTKPKSKHLPFAQHRGKEDNTTYDAVGGFLDYVKAASYAAAVDPNIDIFRKMAEDIGKTPISWSEDGKIQGEVNGMQGFLGDYANMLAGKTSPFDRPVQKLTGRKVFSVFNWAASRIKSNMVLGNVGSSVAQMLNIPNAIGYIGDPASLFLGVKDSVSGILDKKIQKRYNKSTFLNERFSDPFSRFDTKVINIPKKFATWMLGVLDEVGTKYIWNSAYRQAEKKGIKNPVRYADDLTRRMVAGRGIGEVPLAQQSKLIGTMLPFTLEVGNSWRVQRDMWIEMTSSFRDAPKSRKVLELMKGMGRFLALYAANHLFNDIVELIRGTDGGLFDPIEVILDSLLGNDEGDEEDNEEEKTRGEGIGQIPGRMLGEVLGSMSMGQAIAALYPENGFEFFWTEQKYLPREQIFGENNPTRYGTENIFQSGFGNFATNLVLPFGGSQVSKTVKGARGLISEGVYNKRGELKYPVERTPSNVIKGTLFGRSGFKENSEYYKAGGTNILSVTQTEEYKNAKDKVLQYELILDINRVEKEMSKLQDDIKAKYESSEYYDEEKNYNQQKDFKGTAEFEEYDKKRGDLKKKQEDLQKQIDSNLKMTPEELKKKIKEIEKTKGEK